MNRTFDLNDVAVRDINQALHDLSGDDERQHWQILNPKGEHAIACGADVDVQIEVMGHAGYYCAGMNKLAEIIVLAEKYPDSLSQVQQAQYLAYEHIFYDSWETLWVGHRNGLIDRESWESWEQYFSSEARRKPALGRTGNARNMDPEFEAYLEGSLR